jgi:hypothetical protein
MYCRGHPPPKTIYIDSEPIQVEFIRDFGSIINEILFLECTATDICIIMMCRHATIKITPTAFEIKKSHDYHFELSCKSVCIQ